ncbi:phosphate signaling complex protein PhoU [Mycobacterium sp. AMU20-3851]|uniref:phosphate signaling complex protein PhoU n=1 Tax=Mycobacterium sp. AMU20-3851 TaxID=3122055 RepID=UPI003754DC8E
MRTEFHAQLERLTAELGEMCGIAATTAADATAAVVHADTEAARRVRTELTRLDELNECVDQRAFSLLARHAPVAHDLRVVMSAFSIAANADRMGALATNIAGISTRARTGMASPAATLGLFSEMGQRAVKLAEWAEQAVVTGDVEEARRIQDGDAAMNGLHRRLLALVLGGEWSDGVAAATDVVLLGRFYERFADHAVDIARRVLFQATGEISQVSPVSS